MEKYVKQLEYELKCYYKLYEDISEEMSFGENGLWDRINDKLIELEEKVDTNISK